jgi:hypothetical protein
MHAPSTPICNKPNRAQFGNAGKNVTSIFSCANFRFTKIITSKLEVKKKYSKQEKCTTDRKQAKFQVQNNSKLSQIKVLPFYSCVGLHLRVQFMVSLNLLNARARTTSADDRTFCVTFATNWSKNVTRWLKFYVDV